MLILWYNKKKAAPGIRHGRAQSTLEIVAALIPVILIILFVINAFFWVNRRMVWRQHKYEESRLSSGSGSPVFIDESNEATLHLFKGIYDERAEK